MITLKSEKMRINKKTKYIAVLSVSLFLAFFYFNYNRSSELELEKSTSNIKYYPFNVDFEKVNPDNFTNQISSENENLDKGIINDKNYTYIYLSNKELEASNSEIYKILEYLDFIEIYIYVDKFGTVSEKISLWRLPYTNKRVKFIEEVREVIKLKE